MNYDELATYVAKQVENILCFNLDIADCVKEAENNTVRCLSEISGKYYRQDVKDEVRFSVYNSMQYCIFLYFLSKSAYEKYGDDIAEKIYYLNKILNSIDIFYKVDLPSIWGGEHPQGSVMGRAQYNDYFFFYQGCTVGGSFKEDKTYYPILGQNVVLCANSKVLGKSFVGDNVILSANAYVINETIPSNSIVFGQSPNLVIKKKSEEEIKKLIVHIWRD